MLNPLSVQSVFFLEFAGNRSELEALFHQLTLNPIDFKCDHDLMLYQVNEILCFNLNERDDYRQSFEAAHQAGVCSIGLKVKDAMTAYTHAIRQGAVPAPAHRLGQLFSLNGICGIGDTILYFLDETHQTQIEACFQKTYDFRPGNLFRIDHLAFNIFTENLQKYKAFMETVLGFTAQQDFEIFGEKTSFETTSFRLAETDLQFVLSRSHDSSSQISSFLDRFQGEGLQHVAFETKSIVDTLTSFQRKGISFQPTPESYYKNLATRLVNHGEDIAFLQDYHLLLDGDDITRDYLIQIFTKELLGPIFFELIERRGAKGLGEGNITALFKSVERELLTKEGD